MKELDDLLIQIEITEGKDKVGLINKACVMMQRENPQGIAPLAHKGLELAKSLKDNLLIAKCYNSLSMAHSLSGDYDTALQFSFKGLALMEEQDEENGIASYYNNIGLIYINMQEYEKALEYLLKGTNMKMVLGRTEKIDHFYNNIAHVYLNLDQPENALDYHRKALKIRSRDKLNYLYATSLSNIGLVYEYMRDFDKAIDYHTQAKALRETTKDKRGIANSFAILGRIHYEIGNFDTAKRNLANALEMLKDLGEKGWAAECHLTLYQLYKKSEDFKSALIHLEAYNKIKEELFRIEKIRQTKELETKYEIQQKEKEAEIYRLRNVELSEKNSQITMQAQELSRLNEELTELNRAKDNLFSIIAHDLKNPIQIFVGYTELLVLKYKDLTEEKLSHYVENISESAKQISTLMENLMDWSLSQTGRISYSPKIFSLFEIVNKNLDLFKAQANLKKIHLSAEITGDGQICADRNMMDAIIRNLISNALKFTALGGFVKIIAEKQQDDYTVSVIDNGVGISKENREKILSKPGRVVSAGTFREKGSGLGLVIVSEFVKKHNGILEILGEEGKGTTFRITLPQSCNEKD